MRLGIAAWILSAAFSSFSQAQTWDTSGNNLLQGTYYFREVLWLIADSAGNMGRAISIYGTISFDGNGRYTISGAQVMDSNAGVPQNFSIGGTYSIAASGYGFLSSPISTGDSVHGLVSNGIFVGSSTETSFNDLFIAAQLPSPAPTNSFFKGQYSMMGLDFPTGSPPDTRDSQFVLNPDGNGNIGTVTATGAIAGLAARVVSQNVAGVRYFFSNGGANVNFGGSLSSSNLIAGTKYLYFSADGNFVFGGSPTAWDMIVGVRGGGSATAFNGLYYQAGVFQDESQISAGVADLDTFYGSLKAGSGTVLVQERLHSVNANNPLDYTYSRSFTPKADGTYDDSANHYVFGPGGAIRIGVGINPSMGLNVAVQAPAFTPSGVFIDPSGVVNAASSALFTSGLAPGELITIYGTNLASSTLADSNFPLQLGGVQVLINNRAAPVYVVSPTQLSAVVPFATTELIAAVQVVNNGVTSNTVTSYVNLTAPGAFTQPAGGIGYSAALHSDFTVVTPSHPAQVGETISLFVTGLGAVAPTVSDGAPGPISPFSLTTNTIAVYIGGQKATTTFTGLAPQLTGLYQINVQVPANVSGNATLDISGPDFYTSQATLPIGSGSAIAPATTNRTPSRTVLENHRLVVGELRTGRRN